MGFGGLGVALGLGATASTVDVKSLYDSIAWDRLLGHAHSWGFHRPVLALAVSIYTAYPDSVVPGNEADLVIFSDHEGVPTSLLDVPD